MRTGFRFTLYQLRFFAIFRGLCKEILCSH